MASSTVSTWLLSVGVSEAVVNPLDLFASDADRTDRNESLISSGYAGARDMDVCGELSALIEMKGGCGAYGRDLGGPPWLLRGRNCRFSTPIANRSGADICGLGEYPFGGPARGGWRMLGVGC